MTQLALALSSIAGGPCPDCQAAKRRARASGFTNTANLACSACAVVDLDAYLAERQPSQDRKADHEQGI
jgi:endogenous inhibitor of DNA gyrase (YacG/DUF329 family)